MGRNPDQSKLNRGGRPPGSRNKLTVAKENIAKDIDKWIEEKGGIGSLLTELWADRRTRAIACDWIKNRIPKRLDVDVPNGIEVVIVDNLSRE